MKMGHRKEKTHKSHTLPSSPTHSFSSSSSSDFEFTISLSPRKSTTNLCPADELFYKGQLLPLHLSPRISMVRTLILSSSSTSSSCADSTTTASRHSSGSSTDSHSSFSTDGCDSSRPSSATEDEDLKRLNSHKLFTSQTYITHQKKPKYFSLSRFSSVFRKDPKTTSDPADNTSGSSVKRMSLTAKEVFRKYMKKAKPFYEKLSQKQGQQKMAPTALSTAMAKIEELAVKDNGRKENKAISHSFSGNLRYPRRRSSCASSCPSSMRSSPSHSGILCRDIGVTGKSHADTSSMEELQSAIQGAITHCKNSMIQNKPLVNNEI